MTMNDPECSERFSLLLATELLNCLDRDELLILRDRIDEMVDQRNGNGG